MTSGPFIYGLDPAEHSDFFGIVVHTIDKGMAKLATLRKLRNYKYPEVQRLLKEELFTKYPPRYIVIDYSNEKGFAETLEELYGSRVEAFNFTQINKLMLKQDGLKILQMGYEWPVSKNPQVQSWIDECRDQLKHEQMLETSAGRITFDHPEGEHNDLAIAWELSIHGCLRFILKGADGPMVYSRKYDMPLSNKDLLGSGVASRPGVRVTSRSVYYP